jgi:AcrR family transcriptional regulator
VGTRAQRRVATELALREAAVRLIAKRGYEATGTDDIARAAGVSPRTFFNYFPSKESVILLPEGLLSELVAAALRGRPMGEDPVASLAAAAMETVRVIDVWAEPNQPLALASLHLMLTERGIRQIMLDRRAQIETIAWTVLQERGVSPQDLGLRAAVATVVSLTYMALNQWAEAAVTEPVAAVLARCLLLAPDPARLAVGVTS